MACLNWGIGVETISRYGVITNVHCSTTECAVCSCRLHATYVLKEPCLKWNLHTSITVTATLFFGHPIWHLITYWSTTCSLFLVSPSSSTPKRERLYQRKEPRLRCTRHRGRPHSIFGVSLPPSFSAQPPPPPPPPGALSRSGQLRARRVACNGESGEKSPLTSSPVGAVSSSSSPSPLHLFGTDR